MGEESRFMVPAQWVHPFEIAQQQASLHDMVWLQGTILPGWELTRPILLKIEQDEDGEFLVTDSFSIVYGNGKTHQKAQRDYCNSLVEYYEILEQQAGRDVQTALSFRLL